MVKEFQFQFQFIYLVPDAGAPSQRANGGFDKWKNLVMGSEGNGFHKAKRMLNAKVTSK